MGDYVHVKFSICGLIKDPDHIRQLCMAAEHDGFGAWDDQQHLDLFIEAMANGSASVDFEEDEINYGRCPTLEAACQSLGIAYHKSRGAGDGFSAEHETFLPEKGTFISYGNDANILLAKLDHAMNHFNALAKIRQLMEDEKLARGENMPPLAWSQAVKDHFAVEVAKAAILA